MTEKINLIPLNEVYFKVEAEKSILMEMSEYFKFRIPNWQFNPMVKRRLWDGYVRLFSRNNNTIYRGLIEDIKEFCDNREYILEYDEDKNEITNENISSYIKSLKLPFEIRDYQFNAISCGIRNKKALILSPTSSGKSVILYSIARYFSSVSDEKILIIVPTLNLISQLKGDFKDYSKNDSTFGIDRHVHLIYSGQDKKTDRQIIISSWQSLYKMPENYFDQFGCIIIDECHLAQATSIKKILEKCTNASYRFGTTGTLDGSKCNSMVISGLTGPIYETTSTKELMNQNYLSNLSINCIILNYKEEDCKRIRKLKYQEEIDFIISHEKRNTFIKNLAISQKGNTLVLFQYVKKHGIPLYNNIVKKLQEKGDSSRKVFFVSGIVKMEDREKIRNITENETNAIIVAGVQVFSTGVNIKNLESIIFASPSKSKIRTLQSIGRVLRVGRTDKAVLYDIADNLSYKKHKNYSIKHFHQRIQIYDSQDFEYSIYQVDL